MAFCFFSIFKERALQPLLRPLLLQRLHLQPLLRPLLLQRLHLLIGGGGGAGGGFSADFQCLLICAQEQGLYSDLDYGCSIR
jgi:hypothetical protein